MNLFKRFSSRFAPWKLKSQFYFQTFLKRKKYLALAMLALYTPLMIVAAKKYEKQTTLLISKNIEFLSDIQIPQFMRNTVFGTYAKLYNINTQEMTKKFDQYKTFSQFFTRKIKQRPIPKDERAILSPSDSKVLAFGEIKQDSVFVLKGYSYSLGYLLCGEEVQFNQQDINLMKKQKDNKLYHVVLYLAPGDYHRFHAATKFDVVRRKLIQGALFSVDEKQLIAREKVYQKNSRLILHGKWKYGYLGMIMVGALNVGRIVVRDKLNFDVGEEMGHFDLGSTIVLLFQSPQIEWIIEQRQRVKYGEIIGRVGSSK